MTRPDLSAAALLLVEEFQQSGARELHIRSGDFELFLSNDATAEMSRAGTAEPNAPVVARPEKPVEEPVPAPRAPAGQIEAGAAIVSAPHLGTFYRAPKPGADAYVTLGSIVAAGDELCLIEVMKLFTALRANSAGRIDAILAEDGAMVEAGQPFFAIVAA